MRPVLTPSPCRPLLLLPLSCPPPTLWLLAVKHPAGLKLSQAGSRYASTNQLAAAFGFDPYGSQSGANGGSAAGLAYGIHSGRGEAWWQKTLSLRNTSIALDDILDVGSACVCGGGGKGVRVPRISAREWAHADLLQSLVVLRVAADMARYQGRGAVCAQHFMMLILIIHVFTHHHVMLLLLLLLPKTDR